MTTLSMLKIRAAVVVAVLAVSSGSAAVYAQYQTLRIPVNIPFAFEAGSTHFAPGTYTLSHLQEPFLSLRGPSGPALVMNRREADPSPATEGKMVFHNYGDRYFLRELWVKNQTVHLCFPETKAEHRVRKIRKEASHAAIATASNVEIALLESPR